jgi:2-oxo-4-hydroxy-4-carboxy--5-ureidoimidazoline (OHCU) decarboxylase
MRRPFATPDELYAVMVEEVERAHPDKQLALLRAHLGTRARMNAASAGEQASAGLERTGVWKGI